MMKRLNNLRHHSKPDSGPSFEFALDQLERRLAEYGHAADVELWRARSQPGLWFCHFNALYGDTIEKHEHKYFEGTGDTPGKALREAVFKFDAYTTKHGPPSRPTA